MIEMKYANSLKLIAALLLAANAAFLGARLTDSPATPLPEKEASGLRVLGPAPLELPPEPRLCLRWGNFARADYLALRNWLLKREGQHTIHLARASAWWAWLPPQKSPVAEVTLKRLKAAGFADALIVRGGPMRSATALGVFDSEEGACAQRDAAIRAGFVAAACGPRPLPLTGGAVLALAGDGSALTNALAAAFPKARLAATECPVKP